jgi:hypothetical protein
MLTKKPQAVAGVSSNYENIIEDLYPSIATTFIGQLLNGLYESLPGYGQVRLSYLLFIPFTWPLALAAYFLLKISGSKYVVTNRNVKEMSALGTRLIKETPLGNIERISIDPDSRLAFFRTGDIRLSGAAGDTLMLLRGVPFPERFVQVIEEVRQARSATEASLQAIRARK